MHVLHVDGTILHDICCVYGEELHTLQCGEIICPEIILVTDFGLNIETISLMVFPGSSLREIATEHRLMALPLYGDSIILPDLFSIG